VLRQPTCESVVHCEERCIVDGPRRPLLRVVLLQTPRFSSRWRRRGLLEVALHLVKVYLPQTKGSDPSTSLELLKRLYVVLSRLAG